MKIAPLVKAFNKENKFKHIIVHTGQHYDKNMSGNFFHELGIPKSSYNLNIGSGSHAVQTAKIMIGLEDIFRRLAPDMILLVGDVNSTLAATIVAAKMGIPVSHIEAGLRSGDLNMPEEINRLVTDRLSSLLFTHEIEADQNLINEGVLPKRIKFVGNIMIDTLLTNVGAAKRLKLRTKLKLNHQSYALITLHRPSNVDQKKVLANIIKAFVLIQKKITLVWPIHPRTLANLKRFGIYEKLNKIPNFKLLTPLSYLEFLHIMIGAKFVLTDSGGIQEETTALGIPCLTIRNNTERPITITQGTNILVGTSTNKIVHAAMEIINGHAKKGHIPKYWDGHTANRIINCLEKELL